MNLRTKRLAAVLIPLTVACPGLTVLAQEQSQAQSQAQDDGLSEIVVTARRRAQNIQDVSMSISAFSGKQVEELNLQNLQDVSWYTAGLLASGSRGDTDPLYTIRGIGLNDAFNNNNPTVGVYLNEVIQPFSPMMAFQMYDVERIEVLKGPQGTLYGRNTTGGAINLLTRRPGKEVNGYARADYGDLQRYHLEGAIGGPVSENMGVRVAAMTIQQNEGWIRNAFNGQDIGELDQASLRGTLEWQGSDAFQMLLIGSYSRDKSDSAGREHVGFLDGAFSGNLCQPAIDGYRDESQCVSFLGYSDPYPDRYTIENSSLYGQYVDAESIGLTLNLTWQVGDATLSSVTGYSDYDRTYTEDSDGTPLIMIDTRSINEIDVFSQELRLAAVADNGLDWVIGAYGTKDKMFFDFLSALDEHVFLTRLNHYFTQKTTAWAAFAHAEYPLTERLKAVGGVRYTHEKKDFDYTGFDLDPFGTTQMPAFGVVPVGAFEDSISHNEVTGEVGLEFSLGEDTMAYVNASKGFKSGGFKGAVSFTEAELQPFDPETLYAYEVGLKSTLAGGKFRFNTAGYFYDWQDFQAFVTEIRAGVPVLVLSNGGDAEVYGIEVETQWHPVHGLDLSAAANFMDTKITRYNSIPGTADSTGNRLANSPETMLTGRVRYQFPLGGSGWQALASTDTVFRGKVYYSLGNNGQSSQDGFWIWNARLGVISPDARWDISLWGKNLGDKFYVSQSYDNLGGIFPSQNFLGMPRTYGLSVGYNF